VRDAPASVMIPSGLRINAGAEPGRKATVLSMIAPMLISVGLRPFQVVCVGTLAVVNLPKENNIDDLFNLPAFAMGASTDRLIRMPKQQNDVKPLACCRPDAHEIFTYCHFENA